jgi:hypothetical protein
MNVIPHAILFTSLMTISAVTLAATDVKTINVQAVQGTFAELTGSAVDGNINNISMNDIESNAVVSLGTLGVKSNGDNCYIQFSTLNNFSLLHNTSGSLLKRYQLAYLGHQVSTNTDTTIALDSCLIGNSVLTFAARENFSNAIEDGWYQDRVTITLTAE